MQQVIHQHPGKIIQDILIKKKKTNRRYSLRAFAQKLDLSPGNLSQIINGKRGLSEKKALEICKTLNLNKEDKRVFLTSLSLSRLKNTEFRSILHKTLTTEERKYKKSSMNKTLWEEVIDSLAKAIISISTLRNKSQTMETQKSLLKVSAFLYQIEFKSSDQEMKNKEEGLELLKEIEKQIQKVNLL